MMLRNIPASSWHNNHGNNLSFEYDLWTRIQVNWYNLWSGNWNGWDQRSVNSKHGRHQGIMQVCWGDLHIRCWALWQPFTTPSHPHSMTITSYFPLPAISINTFIMFVTMFLYIPCTLDRLERRSDGHNGSLPWRPQMHYEGHKCTMKVTNL